LLLKIFIIPLKKNVAVVVHYGLTCHVIETLTFRTFLLVINAQGPSWSWSYSTWINNYL